MDVNQLSTVIADIIDQKIFQGYKTYLLLLAFTLVNLYFGNMIAGYVKKRGETLATQADFKELTRQVAETTKATEKVRSAISQSDWAAREWNTVQRLKLEEFLSTAYALGKDIDLYRDKWLWGKDVQPDGTLPDKLRMLTSLYFPQMQPHTFHVCVAHEEIVAAIMSTGVELASLELSDMGKRQAALDAYRAKWAPQHMNTLTALRNLETAAAEQMQRLAAGPKAASS